MWIFGDSYAQDLNESHLRGREFSSAGFLNDTFNLSWVLDSWSYQLSSNFDMEIKNFGVCGSALEYSAQRYTENFSNFKDGDIVIFIVTQLERKYLIDSRPSWGIPWQVQEFFKEAGYSQNDIDFYNRAYVEFDRRPNDTILSLLLHSAAALKNRNIKVLFIPCFMDGEVTMREYREKFPGSINETFGHLNSISRQEIIEKFRKEANTSGRDTRINHMHKLNHDVLINKLTDCIVNDAPLDLNNGFVTEVFDHIPTLETNGFLNRERNKAHE